jgi:hypothetical protein
MPLAMTSVWRENAKTFRFEGCVKLVFGGVRLSYLVSLSADR